MHSLSAAAPATAVSQTSTRLPALLALVLGLVVVWGAGFANSAALHNATHDTRHAFGLPCH
jgi:cobalt transporter subunit CbtB